MHKPSSRKPLQEWSSGSCIHSANTSGVRYLSTRRKTHGLSFGEVTAWLGHTEAAGVPGDDPHASVTSQPWNGVRLCASLQ